MHSAIALFDDESASKVERLWEMLATELELVGVQRTPIPHLSWDVFLDANVAGLEGALERRARGMNPLTLELNGLGIFPGADPVLYLNVLKNAHLLELHGSIHEDLTRVVQGRSPLYAPDRWAPHVTLAAHDGDPRRMCMGVVKLLERDLPDQLRVDALGWIDQPTGEVGRLASRFPIGQ